MCLLGRPLDLSLRVLAVVSISLEILQHLGDVISHQWGKEPTPGLLRELFVPDRLAGGLAHGVCHFLESVDGRGAAEDLAFVLGEVGQDGCDPLARVRCGVNQGHLGIWADKVGDCVSAVAGWVWRHRCVEVGHEGAGGNESASEGQSADVLLHLCFAVEMPHVPELAAGDVAGVRQSGEDEKGHANSNGSIRQGSAVVHLVLVCMTVVDCHRVRKNDVRAFESFLKRGGVVHVGSYYLDAFLDELLCLGLAGVTSRSSN